MLLQLSDPAPLIIAKRFYFHKQEKMEGESVADNAAALKNNAERYEFVEVLKQALRDRFFVNWAKKVFKENCQPSKSWIWKGTVGIAHLMESADTHTIKRIQENAPIQYGNTWSKSKAPKICFRCGESHVLQTYKFKKVAWHFWKNQGHIEKVCKKNEAIGNNSMQIW